MVPIKLFVAFVPALPTSPQKVLSRLVVAACPLTVEVKVLVVVEKATVLELIILAVEVPTPLITVVRIFPEVVAKLELIILVVEVATPFTTLVKEFPDEVKVLEEITDEVAEIPFTVVVKVFPTKT